MLCLPEPNTQIQNPKTQIPV